MATSILAGISQEETQLEMLGNITVLLSAILEKLPRVTGNDQAAVSVEGTATVALASNQTLTTLGTVNGAGTKFISGDNMNLAGCVNIYNNITVS